MKQNTTFLIKAIYIEKNFQNKAIKITRITNPNRPNSFCHPLSTRPCCTTYTASLKSAQIKFITLLEQATSYNKTDKKKGSAQLQTRTRHTILEKSLNFSTLDVNVNVHIWDFDRILWHHGSWLVWTVAQCTSRLKVRSLKLKYWFGRSSFVLVQISSKQIKFIYSEKATKFCEIFT